MSDWIGGRRPVTEALAAGRPARRLLLAASAKPSPELRSITDAARRLHLPTDRVPADQLTRLAGFDGHQGVLLEVEERHWASVDEILAMLGLEALSRGARSCDFVETRPSSLHALRANIAALRVRDRRERPIPGVTSVASAQSVLAR